MWYVCDKKEIKEELVVYGRAICYLNAYVLFICITSQEMNIYMYCETLNIVGGPAFQNNKQFLEN